MKTIEIIYELMEAYKKEGFYMSLCNYSRFDDIAPNEIKIIADGTAINIFYMEDRNKFVKCLILEKRR